MPAANPNFWPGTKVPRTFASAFAGAFGGPKVEARPTQPPESPHAVAAPKVLKEKRIGSRGPQPDSKSAQLRRILCTGPKTCAQLAELSKMSTRAVAPLMQHDIAVGHVVLRRERRPFVYVLADSFSLPRKS